jgi:hypothetical protein
MTGFVAGTLVHTERGLVPIQEIKVGDMVLSRPENNEGETHFKKVLRIVDDIEEALISVLFYMDNYVDVEDSLGVCTLYAEVLTDNHLIWVNRVGEFNTDEDPNVCLEWVNTKKLLSGYEVILSNTMVGCVDGLFNMYETLNKDIFYSLNYYGHPNYLLDLSNNQKIIYIVKHLFDDESVKDFIVDPEKPKISSGIRIGTLSIPIVYEFYNFYRSRKDDVFAYREVYTFEVESDYTYFVDEQGLWVHC